MELIRLFMGILLSICLIFYITSSRKLNSMIQLIEPYNTLHTIKPLGLYVKDFKGKVRIEDVLDYTPAKYAGLEIGDKILEINGTKIKDVKTFYKILENPHDNAIIKLVVYRPHCNSKFALEVNSTGYCP